MIIHYEELKRKMPELTGLLFTHPAKQDGRATEIWIKFREEGVYVFFDFEQPLNDKVVLQELVGAGNALNCSDYKKDHELIQYNSLHDVNEILQKSIGFRGNLDGSITKIKELFVGFASEYLYY